MNMDKLIKYVVFALVVFAALKYIPNLNVDQQQIPQYVAVATIAFIVLDQFVLNNGITEGMKPVDTIHRIPALTLEEQEAIEEDNASSALEDQPQNATPPVPSSHYGLTAASMEGVGSDCDPKFKLPCPYQFSSQDQDYLNSGLHYDHNKPGYYLMCNGEYKEGGVPFTDIQKMICASKLHDLYHQHNHHIKWSPHTHIGKSRGFLNWDKTASCCQLKNLE